MASVCFSHSHSTRTLTLILAQQGRKDTSGQTAWANMMSLQSMGSSSKVTRCLLTCILFSKPKVCLRPVRTDCRRETMQVFFFFFVLPGGFRRVTCWSASCLSLIFFFSPRMSASLDLRNKGRSEALRVKRSNFRRFCACGIQLNVSSIIVNNTFIVATEQETVLLQRWNIKLPYL